jgi:hypothetical protein
MLCLSRSFSNDAIIKGLRPHISIRTINGVFPHSVQQIPGFGFCPVIWKNTQVQLVIDFVTLSTQKQTNTIYELNKRLLPGVSANNNDLKELTLRTFETSSGTPLSAKTFFTDEIVCQHILLVFADTNKEVPNTGGRPTIITPRSMAMQKNRLSTYTTTDGVPYPAYTSVEVMQYTSKKMQRLYKFKVVASALYVDKPHSQTQHHTFIAYSDVFAIVSNKHVFKQQL